MALVIGIAPSINLMKPFFDSHVHVWEAPWKDFVVGTWRNNRLGQRDLILALMDRFGVERACVLAARDETNPNNNEFVADLCRLHPQRFVMLSEIPLSDGNKDRLLDDTLKSWRARGFRYILSRSEHPSDWTGLSHERFWERVNAARLCVALNLHPAQAAELVPLIERYPDIRWLVDHRGRPLSKMSEKEHKPVLELAKFPNTFIKISGFYAFSERACEYPYMDLQRFVQRIYDAFGSERMLWGSDAPPVLDFSSYEQTFACLYHHLPKATQQDWDNILGGTAQRILSEPSA